jgi:hypothetical protein
MASSQRSTARFSEMSASAMVSEGALRNGGTDRGLRQRSAADIDRAAMVPRGRTQPRKISEANNDAKTSFEKRLVFVICVILIDGF